MRNLMVEARYAILQHARVPSQFLGVPLGGVLAYIVLIVLGVNISKDWLLRLAVLGVINIGVLGVANSVVNERLLGWNQFQKSTPIRPWAYLLSKYVLGIAMSIVLTIFLPVVGYISQIKIDWLVWLGLLSLLSAGTVVFTAFGLVLAYAAQPQTSQMILPYGGLVLLSPVFLGDAPLPLWAHLALSTLPSSHFIDIVLGVANSIGFSIFSLAQLLLLCLLFTLIVQYLYTNENT